MIEAAGRDPRVPRDGEGDALSRRGGRVHLLLTGESTGGRFALLESVEQKATEPPGHIHTREDQAVYVLEGQVRFRVDGEWLNCHEGTCVLLPRGCEHTYVVECERARLLTILVPAGFEGYYREMDNRDGASHAGEPDFERLVTVAAHYGVEITVPRATTRATRGDGGGDGA